MKRATLTDRAFDGMVWQAGSIGTNMVLRAAVLILLARTIPAYEFGIVAAAVMVTSIVNQFSQIGISRALVQRLELSEEHIRTGFAITFHTGWIASLAVYGSASFIAGLFKIPELIPYIKLLALTVLFSSLAAIPAAMIQRAQRFRSLSLIELSTFVLGFGCVALPLALLGYGAWSLVWAYIVQWGSRWLLFTHLARPKASLIPRWDETRDLLTVGYGYSLGQLGNILATQVDYFVVGRWLGPEALGFYSRAYQFLMLPAQLFGRAASIVLLPTIASIQDQPERVGRAYRRAIGTVAMTTLPVSAVLIIVAPELVRFLLGEQWTEMTLPFQILIASLLFRTSYKISDATSQAIGHMYARAWRQWLYALLVAVGAYAGSRWGIAGVSVGVGLAVVANFMLMTALVHRLTGLSAWQTMMSHLRFALVAAVFAMPVWLAVTAARTARLHDFLVLCAGGTVALAMSVLILTFFKRLLGDEGQWLESLVRRQLRKNGQGD